MAICLNSCACPGTGCGEKEEAEGVGVRSAAVPKFVSFFGYLFLSLCVVKAYAMKNAPQFWRIPSVSFGFRFSVSLAFLLFSFAFGVASST